MLSSLRPHDFVDFLLLKLVDQPVRAAIMCICYSEVAGEFGGLSATVTAG